MIFRQNRLLTIILALGVIGSAWALAHRHSVEMKNRAVEIAVDYSEVAELAGASGLSVTETLLRLKQAGVTSVAIQEETLADLVSQGLVRVGRGLRWPTQVTWVEALTPEIGMMLQASRLPLGRMDAQAALGPVAFELNTEPEYALAMPLGLPEEQIRLAKSAGMTVIARLVNYPNVRREDIEQTADELRDNGIRTVIFASDQVLGFRGAVNDVAEVFKDHGLIYGSVEFAKQKGDQRFSERMKPDLVRVHSISAAEMGGLDQASAAERFVRAARERNIRIAYVRMYDFADANPLKTNLAYMSAITRGLKHYGFALKPVHPFADPAVPMAARILMALGVASGVILLALSVVSMSPRFTWLGFVLFGVIFAAMAASGILIGLKLVALAAAIVFPTLAVLNAVSRTPEEPTGVALRGNLGPAITRFAATVVISAAGGLMIAGLLSLPEFMLRISQFAGVKLAHIAPILLLAFALTAGIGWGPGTWREQKARASESLRRIGSQPVLIWQTVIAFVLLVMVGLLLARSGNEPGVGVSPLELRFRAILDTLLFVRPRTKEFLVGHPALLLGIASALGGRRNLAGLLLVIGMFGEVSVVNTFCHIHTPVAISVYRVVIGAVLGLVIGAALLLLFSRYGKGNTSEVGREETDRERVGVKK